MNLMLDVVLRKLPYKTSFFRQRLNSHAAASTSSRMASGWMGLDSRRLLYAEIRANDMDQQIDYYTKHFGMQLLKRSKDTDQHSAYMGYGPLDSNFAIKIVAPKSDAVPIDIGTGFGHFGIALPDVYSVVEKIKSDGGTVTRDAGPVKGGTTVIAFVKDPSGYLWELIQRKDSPEPLCQVMLRVGDLKKSEEWYSKVLGMKLLRERDTPEYKYTLGFMGYGPEDISAVIELTYNYGTSSYIKGNAFSHVTVATKDIQKTAEQVKAAGGKVLVGPTTVPTTVAAGAHDQRSSSLSLVTEDPDGWRIIFVQQ